MVQSRPGTGHFQACVEMGTDSHQSGVAAHRALAGVAASILEIFNRHAVVATWALPDLTHAHGKILAGILASELPHEVAMLVDSRRFTATPSRRVVASLFDDYFAEAKRQRVVITSLVLREGTSLHGDIALRHGIQIVRQGFTDWVPQSRRNLIVSHGPLGLTAATAGFPAVGKLLGRFDIGFRAKQSLHRASVRRSTEHVVVDVRQLLRDPAKSASRLRSLDRVVAHIAALQATGKIVSETMRDSLARWQPENFVAPVDAVFRPAA